MRKDHSGKNLQNASFHNKELSFANFAGSDLRGASFTGSNLTGADFTNVKTGVTPLNALLIFCAGMVISAYSGYTAMLTGETIQAMLTSSITGIRVGGYTSVIVIVLFILFSIWRGAGSATRYLILPASAIALLVGTVNIITGSGTGMGVFYMILCCLLIVIMFVTGTIARVVTGTLSNVLFLVVILTGVFFSRSAGGFAGAFLMSAGCALVSKRAVSGAKGFESLNKITCIIATKFGTSFRNTRLMHANFSGSEVRNADFSNADISFINWEDSKKINCVLTKPAKPDPQKSKHLLRVKSNEELDAERTMLAYEQTLVSWIRTATVMILSGFVMITFFYKMQGMKDTSDSIVTPGVVGMILILFGFLGLLFAFVQYRTSTTKLLESSHLDARAPISSILAIVILILGFLLFADALFIKN